LGRTVWIPEVMTHAQSILQPQWRKPLGRPIYIYPMPPHVLVDFVVFPPRHGRSVTDF